MTLHDSETALENATIQRLLDLGWDDTADLYNEQVGPDSPTGRQTRDEVVLRRRLAAALAALNPDLPDEALALAEQELTRDRSTLSVINANQEIYDLLKNGVTVTFRNPHGQEEAARVRVVDWDEPARNDFFLAQQMWITGPHHTRRPDVIGFVNGLPLLLIELKKDTVKLKDAYEHNLQDYKDTIPQLFRYNGLIMLANGHDSRLGTLTGRWGHFARWKKISDESEAGIIRLDTMLQAACTPQRLLDLVENFTLFDRGRGETAKIVAKNHQYLGVNNALQKAREIRQNQGRLGVFWHTQGSGKSFSMIFFAQKILRNVPGNWTFVVITDRRDLDDQIYKTFAAVGAVTEPEKTVRAQSGEHLQQLLREDHRYVFTLIQKFHVERGQTYPVLSERDDIIVITDEAHRSQYDILAQNMRTALPNAAFIGFTGTPLIEGEEEKTRDLYGDYVSIYNFRQSIADNATVPLYYENRIPEVELRNEDLKWEMEQLLEEAELSEEAEEKLERAFAREYHIITHDQRLERIAADIVTHYLGRGFQGKAMVVGIDKMTAVRMYDKVQKYWRQRINLDKERLEIATNPDIRAELETRIAAMEKTDMAVVVSQGQNEIRDFKRKGLDILPHRERMNREPLDEYFKDPDHPLSIVFVCAMWMTGFDVPSCSTIYLDKPMRNHTLMQTIARANRVYEGKHNGLIVDYIGIFRSLEQALAIYAAPLPGGEVDRPIKPKDELVEELRAAVELGADFCRQHGVDIHKLEKETDEFTRIALRSEAVDAFLANEDTRQAYLAHANNIERLFKAILPDEQANEFLSIRAAFKSIAEGIRREDPEVDIEDVLVEVEALLDRSLYVKRPEPVEEEPFNLNQIDFDLLRKRFAQGKKNTKAAKLRGNLNVTLQKMVRLNPHRIDYQQRLQQLIDEYNDGRIDVDLFFEKLLKFAEELQGEQERALRERLTEEELALYDILMKPRLELSNEEIEKVKAGARELLETLKQEKLVLDWRKRQQARAAVKLLIGDKLDQYLPPAVDEKLFVNKVNQVYDHIYDKYYGAGRSVYSLAS